MPAHQCSSSQSSSSSSSSRLDSRLKMMMPSKSSSPFITFLLITICCAIMAPHLQTASAIYSPRKVVRIKNLIQAPGPLLAHCRSKSDDLGQWTMTLNQERDISFRTNFWGTTMFWCDFKWASKFKSVPVYDAQHNLCEDERYCNWEVKLDGFYFAAGQSPKDADFKLIAAWE